MSNGLVVLALGLAFACMSVAANAQSWRARAPSNPAAERRWEQAIVRHYASHHKCTGAGAPAWGRASMARYNAEQRRRHPNRYYGN